MTRRATKPRRAAPSRAPAAGALPAKHRLVGLFWSLGPSYARWVELALAKAGTTPQRLRLIALLCENGPMKMCRLSDEMGVTAANVTNLVDALEKGGEIVRRTHPTDRRITLIEATAETRARFASALAGFKDRVGEVFGEFSEREQEQFHSLLERLKGALVARGILEDPRKRK